MARKSFPGGTRAALAAALLGLIAACIWPHTVRIPVQGAKPHHWNPDYFWECPWCRGDRVHYGIDIIRPESTPILAATSGWVIYRNVLPRGGNVVIVLGPACRVHYYAHMSRYNVERWDWVEQGEVIGYVGNTGASDLPHLHYTIFSPIPLPWRWDFRAKSGWRKMFFLNPHEEIMEDYEAPALNAN